MGGELSLEMAYKYLFKVLQLTLTIKSSLAIGAYNCVFLHHTVWMYSQGAVSSERREIGDEQRSQRDNRKSRLQFKLRNVQGTVVTVTWEWQVECVNRSMHLLLVNQMLHFKLSETQAVDERNCELQTPKPFNHVETKSVSS